MKINQTHLVELNRKLEGKSAQEIIHFFLQKLGEKITFGSSLGAEDQVITQIMSQTGLSFDIFTLDTGRLFPETYDLIDRTNNKYKIKIRTMFPDYGEVEEMVG